MKYYCCLMHLFLNPFSVHFFERRLLFSVILQRRDTSIEFKMRKLPKGALSVGTSAKGYMIDHSLACQIMQFYFIWFRGGNCCFGGSATKAANGRPGDDVLARLAFSLWRSLRTLLTHAHGIIAFVNCFQIQFIRRCFQALLIFFYQYFQFIRGLMERNDENSTKQFETR